MVEKNGKAYPVDCVVIACSVMDILRRSCRHVCAAAACLAYAYAAAAADGFRIRMKITAMITSTIAAITIINH